MSEWFRVENTYTHIQLLRWLQETRCVYLQICVLTVNFKSFVSLFQNAVCVGDGEWAGVSRQRFTVHVFSMCLAIFSPNTSVLFLSHESICSTVSLVTPPSYLSVDGYLNRPWLTLAQPPPPLCSLWWRRSLCCDTEETSISLQLKGVPAWRHKGASPKPRHSNVYFLLIFFFIGMCVANDCWATSYTSTAIPSWQCNCVW